VKRTVAFGALWTASAGAAVGLGLLAVSFVDAGGATGTELVAATGSPSAPSTGPSSTASTGSSTAPTDSPAPAPVPAPEPDPAPLTAEQATVAGTVYASCDAGALSLASAPAAGWWLDDSSDPGEVEFENGAQKVEVTVTCVGGAPQFFVEGPRDDGRGRGRGGDDARSGAPVSTAPASSSPAVDDSDGRVDDSGSDDDSDDSGHGRGRGRGGDDD
jgi:hypothetical protein